LAHIDDVAIRPLGKVLEIFEQPDGFLRISLSQMSFTNQHSPLSVVGPNSDLSRQQLACPKSVLTDIPRCPGHIHFCGERTLVTH
jgi:hypothetical protein